MKWTIGYKITGLLFIIVSIFIMMSVVTFKNTNQLMDSYVTISRYEDLLNNIERLRSTMYLAEDGKRGYVITGLDHYLEPF